MRSRAQGHEPLADPVHGVARRDAIQIEFHAGDRLAERRRPIGLRRTELQQPHADATAGGGDGVGRGRLSAPPEPHERRDGDVERPRGSLVHPAGDAENRRQVGGDLDPLARGGPVEPADVGVGAPGARGPVDAVEHRLDRAMHVGRRGAGHRTAERDPPDGAHRGADDRGRGGGCRRRGRGGDDRPQCHDERGGVRTDPHRGHQWAAAATARQPSITPSRHENRSDRPLSRRWSSSAPVGQAWRQ